MNKSIANEGSRTAWPLAIRLEVLPGATVLEKFEHAASFGFDAVELPGRFLKEYHDDLMQCRHKLPLKISSISLGFRGSLLSEQERVRQTCRQDIERLLDLCATLGAAGLVMPPMLTCDAPKRRTGSSIQRSVEALDELLLSQLPSLAEAACQRNVLLMLEPVNRFETEYLMTLKHAAALCECLNRPGIGITADFFHMQLEELKPADSIRQAGRWLRHVHLADNTRVEPGAGSLHFRPGFEALRAIGYQGYIVIECRKLTGPAEVVLPRSAKFLRDELASIGG